MPVQLAKQHCILSQSGPQAQAKEGSCMISGNLHYKPIGQRALLSRFLGGENFWSSGNLPPILLEVESCSHPHVLGLEPIT